jgi:S1-C subfamily serine protease
MESGQETARIHLGYDAFLGVELSTITKAPTVAGVLSGTPAASAGITRGDVITSVAGTHVATATQLRTAIKQHSVGDSVTVTWRDASGAGHSATVTLGTAPVD